MLKHVEYSRKLEKLQQPRQRWQIWDSARMEVIEMSRMVEISKEKIIEGMSIVGRYKKEIPYSVIITSWRNLDFGQNPNIIC